MAGRLEVLFELNIDSVASKGAAAGKQFGNAFVAGAGQYLNDFISKMPEKFRQAAIRGLGGTSLEWNMANAKALLSQGLADPREFKFPQNEASGPSGIQKLLSMGQLSPSHLSDPKAFQNIINDEIKSAFSGGNMQGHARKAYENFWKTVTEETKPAAKGIDWKQSILGAFVGLRHPYIGSRMLNESGVMGGAGGGGGLFGGGAMSFEKAFIALEAVKIAAYGVKEAFEILKHSFEQGFKLFTESSRLGIKSGELFNREFAAKAIGVSVADIEKYMLRQQWGKARTSLQNFGAGSSIRNMSQMFQEMTSSGERLVDSVNRISGEFYVLGFKTIKLEREWDALVMLFGEQLTGIIGNVIDDIQNLFQGMNDSGVTGMLGAQLSANLLPILKVTEALGEAFGTLLIGVWQLYDVLELFIGSVINLIAKIPGLGGMKVDTSHIFDGSSAAWSQMQKAIKRTFTTYGSGPGDGVGQSGTPASGGFKMAQTSTWEKMGYVIGGHQQSPVEKQLILSNQWLAKIHQALKPRKNDTLVNPPGSQGLRVNPA